MLPARFGELRNRDTRRLQEKSKLDVRKSQAVRARLGDAAQRLAVRARADASHLLVRLRGFAERRSIKLGLRAYLIIFGMAIGICT